VKKIAQLLVSLFAAGVLLFSSAQIASSFTHSLTAPHTLPWIDSTHESNCSSCDIYTYNKAFWFQAYSRTYLCYVRDSFAMPEWHNTWGFIETYIGDPAGYGMWCGSDQGGYWGFGLSGAGYPEITADSPWVDSTNDMHYVDSSHTFNGGYGMINPGYVEQNSVLFPANISMASPSLLTVTLNPQAGGTVTSNPAGINCPSGNCQANFSGNVTLTAQSNSGNAFQNWKIDGQPICSTSTYVVTMDQNHTVEADFIPEATDFVYPVLKAGVTDPLLNKADPHGNGWTGPGLGETAEADGHLGQDYVFVGDSSAGKPVYAVANGIVVDVQDGSGTYGWCNNDDHGWGPVVVIKHVKQSGFSTTDAKLTTDSCGTETSPTVVYSLYGHLSKSDLQCRQIHVGQIVSMGDQIGVLGTEGVDWGSSDNTVNMVSHLHFELKDTAGFNENAWYAASQSNHGMCPGTATQTCNPSGVGTGYSYASGFAPHRYIPNVFLSNNQQ